MIINDEDLSFFLDDIYISIQYHTPLCVSTVERTIPFVPNHMQDSHVPSFVRETVEDEKIHGVEVVPSQPPYETQVNYNPKVEPMYTPYYEWGEVGQRGGKHVSRKVQRLLW